MLPKLSNYAEKWENSTDLSFINYKAKCKLDLTTAIVLATLSLLGIALVAAFMGVNTLPFELTKGLEHVAGTLSTIVKPFAIGLGATAGFFVLLASYDAGKGLCILKNESDE